MWVFVHECVRACMNECVRVCPSSYAPRQWAPTQTQALILMYAHVQHARTHTHTNTNTRMDTGNEKVFYHAPAFHTPVCWEVGSRDVIVSHQLRLLDLRQIGIYLYTSYFFVQRCKSLVVCLLVCVWVCLHVCLNVCT